MQRILSSRVDEYYYGRNRGRGRTHVPHGFSDAKSKHSRTYSQIDRFIVRQLATMVWTLMLHHA